VISFAKFTCKRCGFEGSVLTSPTKGEPPCPRCSKPRGTSDVRSASGSNRRLPCTECGAEVEAERGASVICPNCKSFLGCLYPEKPRRHWWQG
jgi:predicted RNA-binding Zn-ribbon protein involved in translation (DUF1610 family)